jgi:hypothetical protein
VDDTSRPRPVGSPLLADVVLDGLGTVRRRRLLRTLVETVRPVAARRRGDRLVRWRIDAGLEYRVTTCSPPPAVALVDAGWPESLARRALDTGEGIEVAATMTLAEILAVSGRADEAAALLDAMPSGSPRERCRREVELAVILCFGLNRSGEAAERLERVLDDAGDDDWGYVAGQVPLMWLLAGEIHLALRAAEDLLADPRRRCRTASAPSWW